MSTELIQCLSLLDQRQVRRFGQSLNGLCEAWDFELFNLALYLKYIYTLIQYTFNFIAMAALTVLIMYSQECSPQIHHILEKVVQELKQIFKSKTNCDKCLFLRWIPEILFDLGWRHPRRLWSQCVETLAGRKWHQIARNPEGEAMPSDLNEMCSF